MKKNYQAPRVVMQIIDVGEYTSGCTAVKINFIDSICVINDYNATPGMLDFALYGGFLTSASCSIPVPAQDDTGTGDGLCYHTSSAMAFTS